MPEGEYSIGGNLMQVGQGIERQQSVTSGGHHMDTRRGFLAGLVTTGAAAGLLRSVHAGQLPGGVPEKAPVQDEPPPDNPNLPSPEKRALEANEKDIKKKVDQLYKLATELKAEVDKTDSSKVLSLALLKKTEEIEKLAKDIRNRSKLQ